MLFEVGDIVMLNPETASSTARECCDFDVEYTVSGQYVSSFSEGQWLNLCGVTYSGGTLIAQLVATNFIKVCKSKLKINIT